MSHKNNLTILILVCLAIDIAIAWMLIAPALSGITANSEDFLNQKKELVTIKTEMASFKDFDTSYQEYNSQIEKMEKMVIDNVLIEKTLALDLIEWLEKKADQENVTIRVVPVKVEPTASQLFNIATFRLSVVGDFSDCLNFISKVENSHWLSEIENTVIVRRDNGIDVTLILKVYAKPEIVVQN
jgi:hypothetical protein